MILSELVSLAWSKTANLSYRLVGASSDQIHIKELTDDSRRAGDGALFFAIRGVQRDGHSFLEQCIASGTRAVVVEMLPEERHPDVCYIIVADSREAMGLAASAWYGHPSRDMIVVGVTGTNGKTTIATLLYRMYMHAGYPTGLLSTVCNYIADRAVPSTHTTPGALHLQALLAQMRDAGCSHVFMEVSSHAVDQHRIAGIMFDGGIFTNLTRDHLDYHGTVLKYLNAKKRFFDALPSSAFALTNVDDQNGEVMLQNTTARRITYGLHSLADYKAQVLECHPDSTELDIDGHEVVVRLVGEFNVYNLLAVYATALQLRMDPLEALSHLSTLASVDGRLETLRSEKRGYTAFVDYAHTPDALVNVLETIGSLRDANRLKGGKIITVVGCGGDRDRGKRPIMANEAVRLSDRVILTSDNPRSEDPEAILSEMKAGLSPDSEARVLSIVDRAEAIRTACMFASHGDYILIAGKGHETYQEIKGVKYPFDDRDVVRSVFAHE